jgi:polysaccharide export outer membrane protein
MSKHLIVFFITIIGLSISASAQVQEYILQPGDVIDIQVVEHPEFSGRHKIRPDGRVNYPVVGEIDVASLTCAQLVKIMEGKLSSYINNPVVSVSIEAYYANKIFIIGAVVRSGEYQIYEPIEVLKALAMCGGLQNAKVKIIKIIRADGTIVDVNTKQLFAAGNKDKYILYPGDTIYVPESFNIPWGLLSTVLSLMSVTMTIIIGINTLSK